PTGTSQPVTLRRPFAQLNLGTTEGSLTNNAGTFTLKSSVIKVKGIADNFNTVSGFGTVTEANKDIEYTFDAVALPLDTEINVAGVDYMYVSMDYLPIVGDNQALITVDATITLNNGQSINHKFTNVPVRENYRTNIVGNLISSSTDFNVVVDDRFVDENNNPNPDNNSWVVENTAAAQAALDNAKSGDVIRLVAGVNYAKLELRPTQANVVKVTTSSHGEFSPVEEYLEHLEQNPNVWHSIPHYTAEFKDITIIGAEGATIEGFVASSGHMSQANVYDYVRDAVIPNGGYYSTILISNLKFENVNFTGKIDINSSDAESVYEGVTFEGCTFTTGGTAESNGAAIRYYNEANNGKVRNITVKKSTFKNCRQGVYVHHVNGVTIENNIFENTGHNAIGIQGHDGPVNLKRVVINNNTFKNINDRIIRFNEVGADSYIEIQKNNATNSGDENHEVIKATSIANGVVTFIKDNDWGTNAVVVNDELKQGNHITASSVSDLGTTTDGKIDTDFGSNESLTMSGGITLDADETNASSGYEGTTGVKVSAGAVLDGQDHTLTVSTKGNWGCAIAATGGKIKDLTVSGAFRGIFMPGANGDVFIDNVTFENVTYTFNSDAGNKNYGVYISNSTLNGWTSFSNAHKEVVFTNCTFGEGSGNAFCRPYNACVFENCEFSTDMEFDTSKVANIVFKNCTYGGVKITAENAVSLKTGEVTFFYNGVGSVRFE
ncbi:MAG: right-handed parallel beta-helix repeat-containing protein, partial [Bacteroidales bacterium]|nr:right-handed parallel beta-helix repeat-containing protein [Bacteroidales bacterium]